MASNAPYTIDGSVNFPPDIGAPPLAISFGGSGQFKSRPANVLNLTGSGTKNIDMGTIPSAGAKIVLIEVDASSTGTAVIVKVNSSSTGGIEIAPGGMALIHNPNPSAGITALEVDYTSDNTVRTWILGD